jgi:hypothetical protein
VAALVAAAALVRDVAFVASVLLAVVAAVPVFTSFAIASFVTALLSHRCLLVIDSYGSTILRTVAKV